MRRTLDAPMDEAYDGDGDIRTRETRFRRALGFADLTAAAMALLLCVNVLGDDSLRVTAFLGLPLVVIVSKLTGLYDRDELLVNKTTVDEIPKLFQLATLYALVFTLLEPELLTGRLGTAQVLVLWGSLLVLTVVGRDAARRIVLGSMSAERCLFVGSDASFERLGAKLRQANKPVELVGRMAIDGDPSDSVVRAGVAALHHMIDDLRVHRVVVEPSDSSPQTTLDFVREAKATGVRVSLLPRILEVVGTSIEVDDVDGLTLLGVRRFGLSRSSVASKRIFDAVGALGVLLLLSPLLAVISILIKLDSRGPVLYRAPRIGRDGDTFEMWKFRSMCFGADEMRAQLVARNQAAAGLFKIADDPRLTRVGARIRRLSLDELPQLVNVLRGEMSLVGPRPLVADEDAQITGLDRRRLQLTPGMTGHWQILGSSRLPLSEMVKLDYLYVASWSLWNDVKILLRTVPYVAKRRGV